MSLFRKEALEAQQVSVLGRILLFTPRIADVLIALVLLFTFLLVLFVIFGSYTRIYAQGDGLWRAGAGVRCDQGISAAGRAHRGSRGAKRRAGDEGCGADHVQPNLPLNRVAELMPYHNHIYPARFLETLSHMAAQRARRCFTRFMPKPTNAATWANLTPASSCSRAGTTPPLP